MENWGGDSTQVIETQRALRSIGVEAWRRDEGAGVADCDLVHIFNMQTSYRALEWFYLASSACKPVVLSTIYWDLRYTKQIEVLRYGASARWARIAQAAPTLAMFLHSVRRLVAERKVMAEQRALLEGVDAVLPNSVAELEILVGRFRLPELRAKAVIVPNAVRAEFADEISAEGFGDRSLPSKYVLMVASFHPVKGQARLIKALMDLREFPLVLVGSKANCYRYAEYCGRLAALRGNTFLLDGVPHESMGRIYRGAKVHALPSLRESPGLSSLEAAVCGANCVVGIHAPVQEYFDSDAFVCDPLDLSSIRAAVVRAWKAPFNEHLRERILRSFTWRKAAEQTLQAYETVLLRAAKDW